MGGRKEGGRVEPSEERRGQASATARARVGASASENDSDRIIHLARRARGDPFERPELVEQQLRTQGGASLRRGDAAPAQTGGCSASQSGRLDASICFSLHSGLGRDRSKGQSGRVCCWGRGPKVRLQRHSPTSATATHRHLRGGCFDESPTRTGHSLTHPPRLRRSSVPSDKRIGRSVLGPRAAPRPRDTDCACAARERSESGWPVRAARPRMGHTSPAATAAECPRAPCPPPPSRSKRQAAPATLRPTLRIVRADRLGAASAGRS